MRFFIYLVEAPANCRFGNTLIDPTTYNPDLICPGTNCDLPSGQSAIIELSLICPDYDGQFSIRGALVQAFSSLRGGIPISESGTCFGLKPDAFFGAADGLTFQPTRFQLTCNDGELLIDMDGSRAPFTDPPTELSSWVISGAQSLNCGSCVTGQNIFATLS